MRTTSIASLGLAVLLSMVGTPALALGPSHPNSAGDPNTMTPNDTTDEVYWQQPPDQADQFLDALTQLQVELVLDESCSMAGAAAPSVCPWFTTNFGLPVTDKMNQLKASLVGCTGPSEGVLDRWSSRVNFAVRLFSNGNHLDANFGSPLAALETAVMGMTFGGSTEMSLALRDAGNHISTYFNNGNTLTCRPNFVLLLSDGDPNGGGTTFDFGGDSVGVGANEPWCGSAYMSGTANAGCGVATHTDMVPGVTGDQLINTYTIGFGLGGSYTPANLISIANLGEGLYFHASSVRALDNAFNKIINNMVSRRRATNTSPTLQLDGLFSGNDAYLASFRPAAGGVWEGNLKRSCLLPNLLPTGNFDGTDTCVYMADPADLTQVIANPNPVDLFTGTNSTDTEVGGVSALLKARLTANMNYPRNILFYRLNGSGFSPFRPGWVFTDDLDMHGIEVIYAINRLNGYTAESDLSDTDGVFDDDVTGKDNDDRQPIAVDPVPLGDPQNAQPLLLRYEPGGATPGPEFIFMPANDGMFHAFRASDGFEVSALIPGELMQPHPAMNYSVRDLFGTFSNARRKPYLLDSSPRLFLDDQNGDLRIGPTEAAFVVTGAGRAGAAYFLMPVRTFNGTFNVSSAVFTLRRAPGTHYADLADTWAPPWLGQMRVGANVERVAIFGSGHIRGYDGVTNLTAPLQVSATVPGPTENEWNISSAIQSETCPNILAGLDPFFTGFCNYVWPFGYPDVLGPQDLAIGPFSREGAYAYRVVFSAFDTEVGDRIEVQGSGGSTADVLTGTLGPVTSDWVYGSEMLLRVVSNGLAQANTGFAIDRVEYLTAAASPTGVPPNQNHVWLPSLFVVDLNRWNGPNGTANGPDISQAMDNSITDDGMLLRFTSSCGGADVNTRCFDPSSGADYDDLRYMRCSISSEISVLDVAGRVDRAYFADECAQLWRLAPGASPGSWVVNRIARLNSDLVGGVWPAAGAAGVPSFNIRKIQTRVDLVRSRCTGVNSIQIVFGTGDQQNPMNTQMLSAGANTNIYGVIWDDNTLDATTDLGDLLDVSGVASVDPKTLPGLGLKGWYVHLSQHEQVLRNPLVFAQTAYFKTFTPSPPNECEPVVPGAGEGSGTARYYVVDSCNSEAAYDSTTVGNYGTIEASDRMAREDTHSDIGMNPTLVASRDAVMIVGESGSVNPRQVSMGRNRFLNWRLRP